MRQTALINLHVTARLLLKNCCKRRTSHELNFSAVKYNFNILVNSQMQCSHVIQTQAQKCDGMHINVDAVYQEGKEAASLHAKPAKHNCIYRLNLPRHF